MKKIQILLTTIVLTLGIATSSIANFKDGFDAFVKGDYKTAFNEFRPLAEQGDLKAQFALGNMYDNGWGVTQNHKAAVKWYRKAAEQGSPAGQFYLGAKYANGTGVLKDYKEAFKWYQKSAKQGLAEAEFRLGLSYILGVGVLKDLSKAKYWIKKAYENPKVGTTKEDVEKAWNDFELWKY